jgi:hypothetical protein
MSDETIKMKFHFAALRAERASARAEGELAAEKRMVNTMIDAIFRLGWNEGYYERMREEDEEDDDDDDSSETEV